jgi:hypothetical protein
MSFKIENIHSHVRTIKIMFTYTLHKTPMRGLQIIVMHWDYIQCVETVCNHVTLYTYQKLYFIPKTFENKI